ncbi:type II toxin-antitoxin system RatA family toxin [Neptuniibacter sp. PT8_73]|uniref:type II toxin-antitoxin system RatA family toxin n=1 Tax=unclassified Neptuniibacter TaxID=2630693 RepID=UPI0039F6D298
MPSIDHSIDIAIPIDELYAITQDYDIRYEWDPFPEHIEMMDGATEIVIGTQVKVVAKSGLEMIVEFVQVKPPHVAAIRMIKGPIILRTFAGSWLLKSLSDDTTRVTFKYSLKSKKWASPWITDKFLSWYFGSKVKARLNGLATYCQNLSSEKVS